MIKGKAEYRNFNAPDEVREFEKGKLELIQIGEGTVGRLTLQPGWRWSLHVKPRVNTQWCEAPHFQYQLSGRLHIVTEEGVEFETEAGDVANLPSGHDAWVVGHEQVVLIDWAGAIHYAQEE